MMGQCVYVELEKKKDSNLKWTTARKFHESNEQNAKPNHLFRSYMSIAIEHIIFL